MKYLTLFFAILLFSQLPAEARLGGGRSMGFRGTRGFAPRTMYRPSNPMPSSFSNASPGAAFPQPQRSAGGFMRGAMGGLAGGFLGSMLFNRMGMAQSPGMMGGNGVPSNGGGGMGFLEIILLAGVGFFIYRLLTQKKREATSSSYSNNSPLEGNFGNSGPSFGTIEGGGQSAIDNQSPADVLRRFENGFSLDNFKFERMDDFLKIQSAWNARNLDSIKAILTPELKANLEFDLRELKNANRVNKMENIAVRSSDLVEAWQEQSNIYATIKFSAQLLDYTIDEATMAVVAGDRNQPVKFEEEWTFVKSSPFTSSEGDTWRLTAISVC